VVGPAELSPREAMVFFAFGIASVPPGGQLSGGQLTGGQLSGGQLPGRILFRLLADLGLAEGAARSLLLRMRREGWLESERSGREARYRLAPVITVAQARMDGQLHRGRRPEWTGSFSGVLYEIPEQARAFRDKLRRTALLLGYATLRPGLLIATTDRWPELAGLLPAQPGGSQLLRITLTLSRSDSREIAARLWRLDALAARYRAVLDQSRARTARARRHRPGAAAFRAFVEAVLPVYEASGRDPGLPAELMPAGWPGDELSAALERAYRSFHPLIVDYLAALHEGADR
jgi:phenylacetic acid degradation operon negative regulatory protein